jgi:hypothetical protein
LTPGVNSSRRRAGAGELPLRRITEPRRPVHIPQPTDEERNVDIEAQSEDPAVDEVPEDQLPDDDEEFAAPPPPVAETGVEA